MIQSCHWRSYTLTSLKRVPFNAGLPQWDNRRCSALGPVAASAQPPKTPRELTLIHFNDVYNIEPRKIEPAGGAAHFAHLVHSYKAENPLVLFSGDCLNPSLLSAFTKGEHMIPILNNIGVHAAAVGNHDFDFGVDVLRSHLWRFNFPWLLSNVLDAKTGKPLGGAQKSHMMTWQGINIGLVGLVEREWLLTIPSIEADRDIEFLDFVEEGRKLANGLRERGAELVIALTHMRAPNDLKLAAEVPEIQLLLGGHDHDYEITKSEPHGTLVIKSGTDFREFSHIKLQLPSTPTGRPTIHCTRVEVPSTTPEEPAVSATVKHYQQLMGARMDEPLGRTFVDLEATFDCVRTRESNVGSLLGDVMRLGLGADAAFFNGGTIRSDQIHHAGKLTLRDFVTMLPFTDELAVVELSGGEWLRALNTGVASGPAKEGRFLQVSNIKFVFDPEKVAGERVVEGSVFVGGEPLDMEKRYKVATKAYLRSGKDGFDSLKHAPVVVDGETAPRLATLVHYLLTRIEELNQQRQGPGCDSGTSTSTRDHTHNDDDNMDALNVPMCLVPVSEAPTKMEPCAHGMDALYYFDQATCLYGIAPRIEGRIQRVGDSKSSITLNGDSISADSVSSSTVSKV